MQSFNLLRTGGQWKALSATGLGASSTVHDRWQQWIKAGVFARLWKAGLKEYDELAGIDWEWLALDGAMTKAPLGGEKPEKIPPTGPNSASNAACSLKRSLLSEGRGVPLAVAIAGANRHDMRLFSATLEALFIARPKPTRKRPQHLCLDKGYDYDEVRALAKEFGFTLHLKSRGEEKEQKKKEGQKVRRWVVERTHSWMNRFRRILTRWEKKAENYPGLLHLACATITLRCAGLFG